MFERSIDTSSAKLVSEGPGVGRRAGSHLSLANCCALGPMLQRQQVVLRGSREGQAGPGGLLQQLQGLGALASKLTGTGGAPCGTQGIGAHHAGLQGWPGVLSTCCYDVYSAAGNGMKGAGLH